MAQDSDAQEDGRTINPAFGFAQGLGRSLYTFISNEYTFFIFMAGIIGFLAGLANYIFVFCYETIYHLVVQSLWGSNYIIIATIAGALILTTLAFVFSSDFVLHYGFPKFLEKVNIKGGALRPLEVFIRSVGSIVTLGFGGSAGQEGPIAQLGGGVGSAIAQAVRISRNHTRVFIACGVSGAIAATFNAPIAAVLFAEEIALIKDFRIGSFLPIVIASAVGTITSRALRGDDPLFSVPTYTFIEYKELVFYAIMGLLLGILSFLFIRLFYWVKDSFEHIKIDQKLKPLLGGLILGGIAIFFPYTLGNGYDHVESVLKAELSLWIIVGLIFLKPIATAITLGSGWPGGVFAPAIFIGAMLGAGFGLGVEYLLSSAVPLSGAYATVGMGTFLAAVTQAPLTSIFLIFELTQNYQVVLPIMISSVLASAVSRFLVGGSLESIELKRKGIDIEEGFEKNLLRSISVGDIMIGNVETIPEDMTLRRVIEYIPTSHHTTFPLVDNEGNMTGIISIQDFKEWIFEESLKDLVVVKEIATLNVITVLASDTLDIVLSKWGKKPVEIIPVVSDDDPRKIVGIVSRRDVIGAYNKALSDRILEEKF